MSDVFRATYHCVIPPNAKRVVRGGKEFARFTQRTGRIVEGSVLPDGKRCRVGTAEYYARIRQKDGRIKRVPLGVADKEAARQLRAKLQLAADQQKAGVDSGLEQSQRLLIGAMAPLPVRRHERDDRGRIVKFAAELALNDLRQAIEGSHLADYATHLAAAGRTANHLWEVCRVVRRVCIACDFRMSEDVEGSALDGYLASVIELGKSYRTRNAALKSMRAFVRWMVNSDRLAKDPLRCLAAINEDADPNRRRRRSLTSEEFSKLIAAAEAGPKIEDVSGRERAMIYVMAAWTGLRRSELAALTPVHVSLNSQPPYVHVPAAETKARRDDQPIPLHPFVADRLSRWMTLQMETVKNPPTKRKTTEPVSHLFHLKTRRGKLRKTSRMMRLDCEAAGLPYLGDLGVADFHSHRAAFITNLCRTADFSTAVDLARHSDPKLTAKIYDRVRLENRVAAINGMHLPTLGIVSTPVAGR